MSGLSNRLMHSTQATLPLWQAPLPFDLIHAEDAARISALGGIGIIRIGEHSTRATLHADISAYKKHHDRPAFCFYHPLPLHHNTSPNRDVVRELCQQAGVGVMDCVQPDHFSVLLDAAVDAKPRVIGFARGLPMATDIAAIKERQIHTFAVCHNVAEAVVAEDMGIDTIVLQGSDAGGLHSRFPNQLPPQPQSSLSLLKQAREVIPCPLVVWGDFPRGCDIVAAMISGADAVMIDRPLLSCADMPLTAEQHAQITAQNETHSIISDQFSTLPMRLLPNLLTDRLHSDDARREIVLYEILRHKPEWRPLCVSASQCPHYGTLHACLKAYRKDIARYLA